ncbi:MAG: elongation factor Ts, partial [Gemmatimonadota bacterium]
ERERQVLIEQAKQEGKPEAIVEKIVEGRMRKFFEQSSLLLQPFVRDADVSVEEMLRRQDDSLSVRRFVRFQIGE